MSHFIVLVIGPDYERQMAPYHEYESTGRDDEFVTDVDVTDETIKEFNKPLKVVRLADGTVLSRWDQALYTKVPAKNAAIQEKLDTLADSLNEEEDPAGAAAIMRETTALERELRQIAMFSRNEFELPEGAVEREMSADEARSHGVGYPSLAQCAEEWNGAKEEDGKFYKRTNVNAHWDWYQVGGRWTGWLKLKPGQAGELGSPGAFGKFGKDGTADMTFKGNVDFAGMRDEAGIKAGITWDKARSIAQELWEPWESVRERLPIDEARNFYHSQPAIRAFKECGDEQFTWEVDDSLIGTRDAYVQAARDRACVPYAVVRDGQWIAKGSMGWWGISHDSVEQRTWNHRVNQMLDELSDDTLLTVVDAHI